MEVLVFFLVIAAVVAGVIYTQSQQAKAQAAQAAAARAASAARAEALRAEAARAEAARIKQAELAAEELSAREARWRTERQEHWANDVELDAEAIAELMIIPSLFDQIDAQNRKDERQVRALTNLLAEGLEEMPSVSREAEVPSGYYAGDPSGIAVWFEGVLETMRLPAGFGTKARLAYTPESRQLVVEFEFPTVKVVPTAKAYRYVRSRDRLTKTARPATQIKSLYGGAIAQLTLLTLANIFSCDIKRHVDVVVFNGVVDTLDPRSGQPVRPCLITVRVTKDAFAEVNLAHVDPAACLRHLSAGVSRSPTELLPVRPVVEFSMVDPRFVAETDTLSAMDSRPNLMDLTPSDFESLIQNLFTSMGLEARQTRPSRDGGVDCVAYDTRPIFGGKVVIQAKRYKNTVGVSAVRDLFGTLQNEGASKGILVTTSGYGSASFDFASNKPIELIDGANLLYLLEEHANITARIEPPDDWRDPLPDIAEAD